MRDEILDDIMGRVEIEIETPTLKSSFGADFYYSSPDSFRANIRGLLGSTPGALVSIGDSTAAYFPGKGTLFVAVSEPGKENPVLGLNIEFTDLAKTMIGTFRPDSMDSLVNFSDEGNNYELIYKRDNEFVRIEILPTKWIIGSKQIYNESGTSLLDIGYDEFVIRNNIARASRITIINPMRNEKVVIRIEREYFDRNLPNDIFRLDIPEDVPVVNLL